jgi:hypothetical protein
MCSRAHLQVSESGRYQPTNDREVSDMQWELLRIVCVCDINAVLRMIMIMIIMQTWRDDHAKQDGVRIEAKQSKAAMEKCW